MSEDLEEIASLASDPEHAATYRELRRRLPELSEEEAMERWREIAK